MKHTLQGIIGACAFAALALPSWAADAPPANPGVAPAAAKADNTARNERDRTGTSLTPLDQKNNAADLETTAQIRKELTAADQLSMNAKNVKIITQNGHVTLRGPVKTAEEKRLIGEIAARVASAANVDNQLEVKGSENVSHH